MAKLGGVSITCPVCEVAFSVPVDVLSVDERTHRVLLAVDRTEVYGHLRQCAAKAGEQSARELTSGGPSKAELAGRIHRLLDMRAYVVQGGSRACTMCGMAGASCMALIGQNTREGCCQACMNGNTHRAPQDDQACAEWAVVHAPKH